MKNTFGSFVAKPVAPESIIEVMGAYDHQEQTWVTPAGFRAEPISTTCTYHGPKCSPDGREGWE